MSDTYAEDGRLDREAEREEFEEWWQALDDEELEAWCDRLPAGKETLVSLMALGDMLPRKEEEDDTPKSI